MEKDGIAIFPGIGNGNASSIDPNLLLALNNGGMGGNGNWMWLIFLWMMWQRNGANGNFNDYAAQFGSEGRQYLAEIMNGRFDNLNTLAQIINTSVETVKSGIFTLQSSIQTVGAQVGMSALETQNSIAMGNAALAKQLCECCCENRLAIANQTAALQSQMAAHDSNVRLQLAQNEAADQLAVCQQTNALSTQGDRNTNSILNAIAAQTTAMTKEFCDLKERELQNKINTQGDIITQLRNQISNDQQTLIFNRAFSALDDKIDAIAAKQPNTVPVTWPNLIAANATPYVGGYGYGYGYGNGFGNGVVL
jgi:hypothetical protein